MAKKLNIVAQYAMDSFYTNYKADTDFFQLSDFVFNVGNAISSIYFQLYQQKYAEIRQERRDDVVSFDESLLNEEILEVKKVGDTYSATLSQSYMAFAYDNQSIGLQNVFVIEPDFYELERTNISALWRLKYLPATNRIFFYGDSGKISFANKGTCNIKKIRVLYVPSITDEMIVADGIIDDAVSKALLTMRQIQTGVVVDKTMNGNPNKVIQTELAPIGK